MKEVYILIHISMVKITLYFMVKPQDGPDDNSIMGYTVLIIKTRYV